MRIVIVFGTRPEAIKMIPVVDAFRDEGRHEIKVCVTGQHRQMLDQVTELFGTKVDHDLSIMKPNQDLTDITSAVLIGMRSFLKDWRPDWLLCQGDTTTAMASALAAFYEKVSVGHVEAGLRTGNIYSPWPEEMNRKIISAIATDSYAPTAQSRQNLLNEGISDEKIVVTGNTVIDSLLKVAGRIDNDESLRKSLDEKFPFLDPSKKLVLVTGHRRENFGPGFERVCNALKSIGERGDTQVVYPVHLNPNVQEPVNRILGGQKDIALTDPQDYLPFVYLMKRSTIIISDSGGVQEEAPSLGKPVLVTRDTTERPEGVTAGTVLLVGTDGGRLKAEAEKLLDDNVAYEKMSAAHNPYGDGRAAYRITKRFE